MERSQVCSRGHASEPECVRYASASIDDVAASRGGASKPAVMTKKKKNKLIQQECTQFGNVLSHPSFQDNPLATLQAHLQAVADVRKARQEKEKEKEKEK